MYELYLDKISIKESKQKERLVYKKHDWLDDLNIPILILISPIIWFSKVLYERTGLVNNEILIHIVALLLLFIGLISLYRNLSKIWELKSIETKSPKEINRQKILSISEELGIEIYKNNRDFFIGVHNKSSPFSQIITIIYSKNKILFNARNNCIGYNGKLGRPPFGLNLAKKLFEVYRKEIESKVLGS
ncbi:hypothetical protein JKA74_09340 [Marivirga sp. S37H4]|uniref:YcxB-like protein domain-containing protein n=1 Tax=Marivirga aurantiaca TaxID=2802615 RepID=A0A935C8X7_9BACT|nr:hypothetical protein [Marivirga aurantiaca]MBK6265242.1 hypothetical protein [Marivirga aurantiaca]